MNYEQIQALKADNARLQKEVTDLLRQLRIPGGWVCPKCGFGLRKSALFIQSGTVGPDDSIFGETCPNDGTAMQPLTLHKAYLDMCKGIEGLLNQKEYIMQRHDAWRKVAEDLAISLREMHAKAGEEFWVYPEQDDKPIEVSFDLGDAYCDSEMCERTEVALNQFNTIYQPHIPTEPIPENTDVETTNPS